MRGGAGAAGCAPRAPRIPPPPAARPRKVDRDVQRHGAVFEEHDAVGERHGLGDVVRNQNRGEALAPPGGFEQLLHLDARQGVKRAERLVEREQSRAADKRAGEGDALFLSAGQSRRPVVGAVGEADGSDRLKRPLTTRRRTTFGPQAHFDVGEHARPRQQSRLLKHDARHAPRIVDGAFAEKNAPAVGLVQAREQAQQRALAAAASPYDGQELASRSVQIEAIQHGLSAEALDEPTGGDRRARRGGSTEVRVEIGQGAAGRQHGRS